MNVILEELTHYNFDLARGIKRDDIPEEYVDNASTIMELTDYGTAHHCIGHTFLIKLNGCPVGIILLGEAIPWETDPPQVKQEAFYRLMGFVIDKEYRGKGIGGEALKKSIACVYHEFGKRPIVLGCHRNNWRAAAFYERHGFVKTEYKEGKDIYYLFFPD